MSSANADRNLLYGVLALQMGFIGRDALISALTDWVAAKDKPLGRILIDRQAISEAIPGSEGKDGRFKKRKTVPVLWDRLTNEILFGATSIAQVDRLNELHPVDRDRRYRTAGVEPGDDAGRLVHLAQDPAPENMAIGVDVAWPGHQAKDRFAADFGHGRPFLFWAA